MTEKALYSTKNERGQWYLKWRGGGELPDALKGFYTTQGLAEQTLSLFLASKATPPAKTKDKRGSEPSI